MPAGAPAYTPRLSDDFTRDKGSHENETESQRFLSS
ncbi:MAG: hypothetical protein JWM93_1752 [Frankiales bacterium]|nr:hypothetical protein [Frankiales bacterium]